MTEIARLLIDLQRTRTPEEGVALGLALRDGAPVFAARDGFTAAALR